MINLISYVEKISYKVYNDKEQKSNSINEIPVAKIKLAKKNTKKIF